ncbi:MAG: hypothetical protein LBK58_04270 [Prevotellaceae bacterium]|jgi:cyanate permease|nr:hypothetical protein [Prevotellaceae bacterium]
MKKYLLVMVVGLLFVVLPTFAQSADSAESISAFDVTTFAGITAAISLVVTQIAKLIPLIAEKTLYKVLCSLVIGVACCFLSQKLGFAEFLDNMPWWQVLLHGVAAGLTAAGAFDLFKSLSGKKE